jgi:hypothetical protein
LLSSIVTSSGICHFAVQVGLDFAQCDPFIRVSIAFAIRCTIKRLKNILCKKAVLSLFVPTRDLVLSGRRNYGEWRSRSLLWCYSNPGRIPDEVGVVS